MRFNLFGFKGELSTTGGQKKKKGKSKQEEDVIVGGTFRVQSEFGPSSSRFKAKSMSVAKLQENGAQNGNFKPKNWCGTPIPKQEGPPPPGGYSAEVIPEQNDVISTPPKLKSNLKKTAPIPPQIEPKIIQNEVKSVNQEPKPSQSEEIKTKITDNEEKTPRKIETKSESESEDEFGGKISKSTPNLNQNDSKMNKEENQKQFITLGGFDDDNNESSDEDSEDEYGAIKSPKKAEDNTYYGTTSTSFEKVHIKQPQPQHQEAPKAAKTMSNFGYSDQAASIFFRSDSPEPEQRIRNFSIKKGGGDDDDNLSQTSA